MLQSYYFTTGFKGPSGISKEDMKKWEGAGLDPFETEEKIQELLAPSSFASKEIEAMITEKIKEAQANGDVATEAAWKQRQVERTLQSVDETVNTKFFAEFISFLLGKIPNDCCEYEVIRQTGIDPSYWMGERWDAILNQGTGWKIDKQPPIGRVDKYGDEIRAYIQTFLDRHHRMIAKTVELRLLGPKSLADHWLFFKYIVKGNIKDFGTRPIPELFIDTFNWAGNDAESPFDLADNRILARLEIPGSSNIKNSVPYGYDRFINPCTVGVDDTRDMCNWDMESIRNDIGRGLSLDAAIENLVRRRGRRPAPAGAPAPAAPGTAPPPGPPGPPGPAPGKPAARPPRVRAKPPPVAPKAAAKEPARRSARIAAKSAPATARTASSAAPVTTPASTTMPATTTPAPSTISPETAPVAPAATPTAPSVILSPPTAAVAAVAPSTTVPAPTAAPAASMASASASIPTATPSSAALSSALSSPAVVDSTTSVLGANTGILTGNLAHTFGPTPTGPPPPSAFAYPSFLPPMTGAAPPMPSIFTHNMPGYRPMFTPPPFVFGAPIPQFTGGHPPPPPPPTINVMNGTALENPAIVQDLLNRHQDAFEKAMTRFLDPYLKNNEAMSSKILDTFNTIKEDRAEFVKALNKKEGGPIPAPSPKSFELDYDRLAAMLDKPVPKPAEFDYARLAAMLKTPEPVNNISVQPPNVTFDSQKIGAEIAKNLNIDTGGIEAAIRGIVPGGVNVNIDSNQIAQSITDKMNQFIESKNNDSAAMVKMIQGQLSPLVDQLKMVSQPINQNDLAKTIAAMMPKPDNVPQVTQAELQKMRETDLQIMGLIHNLGKSIETLNHKVSAADKETTSLTSNLFSFMSQKPVEPPPQVIKERQEVIYKPVHETPVINFDSSSIVNAINDLSGKVSSIDQKWAQNLVNPEEIKAVNANLNKLQLVVDTGLKTLNDTQNAFIDNVNTERDLFAEKLTALAKNSYSDTLSLISSARDATSLEEIISQLGKKAVFGLDDKQASDLTRFAQNRLSGLRDKTSAIEQGIEESRNLQSDLAQSLNVIAKQNEKLADLNKKFQQLAKSAQVEKTLVDAISELKESQLPAAEKYESFVNSVGKIEEKLSNLNNTLTDLKIPAGEKAEPLTKEDLGEITKIFQAAHTQANQKQFQDMANFLTTRDTSFKDSLSNSLTDHLSTIAEIQQKSLDAQKESTEKITEQLAITGNAQIDRLNDKAQALIDLQAEKFTTTVEQLKGISEKAHQTSAKLVELTQKTNQKLGSLSTNLKSMQTENRTQLNKSNAQTVQALKDLSGALRIVQNNAASFSENGTPVPAAIENASKFVENITGEPVKAQTMNEIIAKTDEAIEDIEEIDIMSGGEPVPVFPPIFIPPEQSVVAPPPNPPEIQPPLPIEEQLKEEISAVIDASAKGNEGAIFNAQLNNDIAALPLKVVDDVMGALNGFIPPAEPSENAQLRDYSEKISTEFPTKMNEWAFQQVLINSLMSLSDWNSSGHESWMKNATGAMHILSKLAVDFKEVGVWGNTEEIKKEANELHRKALSAYDGISKAAINAQRHVDTEKAQKFQVANDLPVPIPSQVMVTPSELKIETEAEKYSKQAYAMRDARGGGELFDYEELMIERGISEVDAKGILADAAKYSMQDVDDLAGLMDHTIYQPADLIDAQIDMSNQDPKSLYNETLYYADMLERLAQKGDISGDIKEGFNQAVGTIQNRIVENFAKSNEAYKTMENEISAKLGEYYEILRLNNKMSDERKKTHAEYAKLFVSTFLKEYGENTFHNMVLRDETNKPMNPSEIAPRLIQYVREFSKEELVNVTNMASNSISVVPNETVVNDVPNLIDAMYQKTFEELAQKGAPAEDLQALQQIFKPATLKIIENDKSIWDRIIDNVNKSRDSTVSFIENMTREIEVRRAQAGAGGFDQVAFVRRKIEMLGRVGVPAKTREYVLKRLPSVPFSAQELKNYDPNKTYAHSYLQSELQGRGVKENRGKRGREEGEIQPYIISKGNGGEKGPKRVRPDMIETAIAGKEINIGAPVKLTNAEYYQTFHNPDEAAIAKEADQKIENLAKYGNEILVGIVSDREQLANVQIGTPEYKEIENRINKGKTEIDQLYTAARKIRMTEMGERAFGGQYIDRFNDTGPMDKVLQIAMEDSVEREMAKKAGKKESFTWEIQTKEQALEKGRRQQQFVENSLKKKFDPASFTDPENFEAFENWQRTSDYHRTHMESDWYKSKERYFEAQAMAAPGVEVPKFEIYSDLFPTVHYTGQVWNNEDKRLFDEFIVQMGKEQRGTPLDQWKLDAETIRYIRATHFNNLSHNNLLKLRYLGLSNQDYTYIRENNHFFSTKPQQFFDNLDRQANSDIMVKPPSNFAKPGGDYKVTSASLELILDKKRTNVLQTLKQEWLKKYLPAASTRDTYVSHLNNIYNKKKISTPHYDWRDCGYTADEFIAVFGKDSKNWPETARTVLRWKALKGYKPFDKQKDSGHEIKIAKYGFQEIGLGKIKVNKNETSRQLSHRVKTLPTPQNMTGSAKINNMGNKTRMGLGLG